MNKTYLYSVLCCFLLLGGATACKSEKKVGLANPASQNCINAGGTLQMATRGDGGQYGICLFEDGRQCEEWALYKGNCPQGGLKVTGYETPQGIYCAITGGTVLKNEKRCQLPSGKVCSAQGYFNGSCPKNKK